MWIWESEKNRHSLGSARFTFTALQRIVFFYAFTAVNCLLLRWIIQMITMNGLDLRAVFFKNHFGPKWRFSRWKTAIIFGFSMKFCRTIWCPFIFLDLLSTPKSGVKVDLWRFGRFHQNWPRFFTFVSYSSRIGLKWPQQNSTLKKNKKSFWVSGPFLTDGQMWKIYRSTFRFFFSNSR